VPAGTLTIDWPALMRFKRSLIDSTPERTEQAWAKIGVEQSHGRARFVDTTTLAVGNDRLIGRRVLIAAGAIPAPLKFPGADRLATSGARPLEGFDPDLADLLVRRTRELGRCLSRKAPAASSERICSGPTRPRSSISSPSRSG